jgi:SHS2 domain-containing protein
MRFEILEHPADIGFRAFGADLKELFANCALALVSIAGDPPAADEATEYPLAVESGDRESLLVDWLSEVLFWFDGRRVTFREFRVIRLENTRIEAVGIGGPRGTVRVIVKAITYHQLRIAETADGWLAEVYVDI